VKNIKARGGRFGPGKVHIPAFGTKAADGVALCCGHVYGDPTDEPADCKRCIRKDHP
jgi:hypothetical protein